MKKGLFLLLSLLVLLVGCGGNGTDSGNSNGASQTGGETAALSESKAESAGEPIKIGIVLAGTGPFAELGADVRRGLDLYLEQKGGKLVGRDVEVIYEDGEGDPQVSLRKFRQVVLNQEADLIIAGDSTAVLYALRDEIEKNNKIMFVPISAGNDIAWEQKSEYIFRLGFSNWQGGTTAGQYSANHIGKKAIAFASDYPGGDEGLASFKAAYEANGGEIVETFRPPQGASDYATYINQMAQIDADVIYCFLVGSDSVRFLTQFHDMGMKDKIEIISPFSFAETTVIDAAGSGAEGALAATPYSPWLERELNQSFVEAYQEKYDMLPTNQSVAGYDIGQLIEKAVQETGSLDPDDLKEVIKGMNIDSPRGPLTIDPVTHDPIQNFYITQNVQGEDRIVLEILETYEQIQIPAEPPAE